jgi:WD40 repeat protein
VHDIFISYAREDSFRVRRLVEALVAARGWSMWWDTALRAGEQYPREFQDALASARCVVVVWSSHAVESSWVVAEASDGWQRGVLVPVLFEACEPPLPFRQTQAQDLSDWRGAHETPALLALIEAIERVLTKQPAATQPELEERAARVRERRRRRMMRRLVGGAAVLVVLALVAVGYEVFAVRRAANALAGRADSLRAEVLHISGDDANKKWWYVLMEQRDRLDRLDLATLVAIEAYRQARTQHTEATLRSLLAISPWSDEHVEIENSVGALAFSADGRFIIASGGRDDTLVFDRAAKRISAHIAHGGMAGADMWTDARGRRVHRGAFVLDTSPTQPLIATAGPDHDAALWSLETGAAVARLAHEDTVTAVSFSPKGDALASVTEHGTVHVWDVASGRELRRLEQSGLSYWVGVSGSGRFVASTADENVHVWDLASGAPVATLPLGGPEGAARFAADERSIVTFGSAVPATVVWRLPSGTRLARIPVQSDEQAGALFAPDGRALVIGDTDGRLHWWDLDPLEERFSRPVDGFVIQLAQSADRARVASDALDVARVWDVGTGHELRQMPYADWLTAIALSRDGRFLASAGDDTPSSTAIEVTEIAPADPAAAACAHVRRNLSPDEWREYLGEQRRYRETCPGRGDGAATE